jgi:hypothetical protein
VCPRQPKRENLPGSAIFNDLQIPESDCRKTCAPRSFFFARPQNPTSPHNPHRSNAVTHVRGANGGDRCPRKRNPPPHEPRSRRAPFPAVAKESDRSDRSVRSVRSIPGDPAEAVRGAAADAAVFLDRGPVHRPAFRSASYQPEAPASHTNPKRQRGGPKDHPHDSSQPTESALISCFVAAPIGAQQISPGHRPGCRKHRPGLKAV